MSTKNKMIVEKIKRYGTIKLERTLRETETNIPKERKCFSMKKIAPILRAIVPSEALTEIVRATGSPVDDLVLQIVRALVPKGA